MPDGVLHDADILDLREKIPELINELRRFQTIGNDVIHGSDGAIVFRQVCRLGCEGIVSKRRARFAARTDRRIFRLP